MVVCKETKYNIELNADEAWAIKQLATTLLETNNSGPFILAMIKNKISYTPSLRELIENLLYQFRDGLK